MEPSYIFFFLDNKTEKKICLDLLYLLKRRHTGQNGSLKPGILFTYHPSASLRIHSSGILIKTLIP